MTNPDADDHAWRMYWIYGDPERRLTAAGAAKGLLTALDRQDRGHPLRYSWNDYQYPVGTLEDSHHAIRVKGPDHVHGAVEDTLREHDVVVEVKDYDPDPVVKRGYEAGTRLAHRFWELCQDDHFEDAIVLEPAFFVHMIHGLMENIDHDAEYTLETQVYAELLERIPRGLKHRLDALGDHIDPEDLPDEDNR